MTERRGGAAHPCRGTLLDVRRLLLVIVALGWVLTTETSTRPWLSVAFPALGILFAAGERT